MPVVKMQTQSTPSSSTVLQLGTRLALPESVRLQRAEMAMALAKVMPSAHLTADDAPSQDLMDAISALCADEKSSAVRKLLAQAQARLRKEQQS